MATSTLYQNSPLGSPGSSPRSCSYLPREQPFQAKADWRASFTKVNKETTREQIYKPPILRQRNDISVLDKGQQLELTDPLDKVGKILKCYVCQINIGETNFPNHLFFGGVYCTLCNVRSDDCRSFERFQTTMKRYSSCQHNFTYMGDPCEYLLSRLSGSDDIDMGGSTLPSKLRVMQHYLNKLFSLQLRCPWSSAIRKCKIMLLKKSTLIPHHSNGHVKVKDSLDERRNPLHTDEYCRLSENYVNLQNCVLTLENESNGHDENLIQESENNTYDKNLTRENDIEVYGRNRNHEIYNNEYSRNLTQKGKKGSDSHLKTSLEGFTCSIQNDHEANEESDTDVGFLTQTYDLKQLEQEVEYVKLENPCKPKEHQGYDKLKKSKKRRKVSHYKSLMSNRLISEKKRRSSMVFGKKEKKVEEEESTLIKEDVALPEDGYYLMIREPVDECPICYKFLNPTNCTVDLKTFLFTVSCTECNLLIYIVPELPNGLKIITDTKGNENTLQKKQNVLPPIKENDLASKKQSNLSSRKVGPRDFFAK